MCEFVETHAVPSAYIACCLESISSALFTRLEKYFLDSKCKFDLAQFLDNDQKPVIFINCSNGACEPVTDSAVGRGTLADIRSWAAPNPLTLTLGAPLPTLFSRGLFHVTSRGRFCLAHSNL